MNRSDSIANLAKAIALAQPHISNPSLDAVNPHFRSRYATLAAHIAAVRAPLAAQGISVVQSTRIDVPGAVVVVTSLIHSSGEWLSSELALPSGATPQTYGSALTYARRYALAALCGIVGDEDDDANAATPQEARRAETQEDREAVGCRSPVGGAIVGRLRPPRQSRGAGTGG